MPSIYDLEMALLIAEAESLSAVALQLGTSQSTISRRLSQLESELGTVLFLRSRSGVIPTAAGNSLLEYARSTVDGYHQLIVRLRETGPALAGVIPLITSTAPATMMSELLAGFRRHHPGVTFDIDIADSAAVVRALVDKRAAIGFSGSPSNDPRLEEIPIATDEIVVIVPPSHPSAATGRLTLADLEGQELVRREHGSGTQATLRTVLATHGLDLDRLNGAITVGTADAVVSAVSAGLGIGAVSRRALRQRDGVVPVSLVGADLTRQIWVVWHRGRQRPDQVDQFLRYVQQCQ